jgi:hypothetical protein
MKSKLGILTSLALLVSCGTGQADTITLVVRSGLSAAPS